MVGLDKSVTDANRQAADFIDWRVGGLEIRAFNSRNPQSSPCEQCIIGSYERAESLRKWTCYLHNSRLECKNYQLLIHYGRGHNERAPHHAHASQTTRNPDLHVIQNCCKANEAGGAMKTLLLMTAKGVRCIAILTLLLSPLALIPARAEAKSITFGEIELSGSFTLNPAYNFNQPTAQPFGSFTDLTVIQASGIFTPLEHSGDALVMNTPFVLTQPSTSNPMVWSIGGYTMTSSSILITGADIAGRNMFGVFDLSGHHFDHALSALGARGFWDFTAPPYDISNFTSPVTGPINLTIHEVFDKGQGAPKASSLLLSDEAFDNGQGTHKASSLLLSDAAFDNGHDIPEPSSLLLLACGLALLAGWRWKQQASATT